MQYCMYTEYNELVTSQDTENIICLFAQIFMNKYL